MSDRNPSPPPETSEDFQKLRGDKIGDSVFSQHWLFQALLKVIQYVETREEAQNDEANSDRNSSAMDIDELQPDLEDEMCNLWDMSADSDVAHFLVDFKARDIFLGLMDKTISPRLLEIVTGIMGNMAFYEDICDHFSENKTFVQAILQLLGTTDTPTLIQIIRLIHVCLASPHSGTVWTKAIKDDSAHLDHIKFALGNSLNGDLLKSTLKLSYVLLDQHKDLSNLWGIDSFVKALTQAANQLVILNDTESLVEYWHVLHLLCRTVGDLELIATYEALIGQHLRIYVSHFLQNEDPTPPPHHVTGLAAAFATFNSLSAAENPDIGTLALLKDASIMHYVKNLHSLLEGKLSVQSEGDLPDPSNLELLFDVLTDTVSLSLQLTAKSEERQR